jgi:hypothetical protein
MEMDDDNALHHALLAREDQERPIDANSNSDDAILSQLLVASGADKNAPSANNKRCCTPPKDREMLILPIFTFLTWLGFVLTLFSTYSCNLIHITWTGSEQESITGVGVSRYQQKTRRQAERVKEIKCYEQASYVQHEETSKSDHFFPTNNFMQTCSWLAWACSGLVLAGIMMYMIVASISPEKFMNRSSNLKYPWKAMSLCCVLAGTTLMAAGTAELLVILDLLNIADPTNDHRESPICNDEYSTCRLGNGGKLAVTGVACCYAGGLLAFFAAMVTVRTRHRNSDEKVGSDEETNLRGFS